MSICGIRHVSRCRVVIEDCPRSRKFCIKETTATDMPLRNFSYPKRKVVVRARAITMGSVHKKIAARPSSRPT